eukprot:scaffold897_cov402-Prasinococcus_capsulatus_cf.AAC.24
MCHCGEGTHSCRVKLNNIRGGRTLFGFLLKRLHQDRCPHRDIGGPGVRKEQHDHSAEVQPILSNASLQQGHEGIQGSRLEELAVIDDDNGILALCYRRTDVPNQAALKLAQPLHSAEGVYESRRGQPHNALAARVASEAVASLGQRFRQALGEPVLPKSNATCSHRRTGRSVIVRSRAGQAQVFKRSKSVLRVATHTGRQGGQ